MTKNAEMKWVVTKGNENLSIKPLSFLGDIRRLMWVVDRGSEFQMIRMALDQVWNINVPTKRGQKKKKDEISITELARHLGDMSLKDSEYTTYFVEMVSREPSFKDLFESPKERAACPAQQHGN